MGRINDFLEMLRERRVGFVMDEVMSGSHSFENGFGPEGEQPFEFQVTWGPRHLSQWINPFGDKFLSQPLSGKITVGGLCREAQCTGTFALKYFWEGKIRYTFDFQANGKAYHYKGEKVNIRPWNLHVSHLTCYGTVVEKDAENLVSRSVVFFRLRTAPKFLASFRFA